MIIYTDGGCEPNPGEGGWAFAVYQYQDIQYIEYGYEKDTTNNRMELQAVINAIIYSEHESGVTIYSDSKYVVDGFNFWMYKWRKKGWKKKGGEIKNLDFWKKLNQLKIENPFIELDWVRGHNGSEGNELADYYATQAIELKKSGMVL